MKAVFWLGIMVSTQISRFTSQVVKNLLAHLTYLRFGQPRPQDLPLDDFQNSGSSGEDPVKGWVTWYKGSKNLGDFYHVTFWEDQKKMAAFTLERGIVMHEAVMASWEHDTLFSPGFWKQVALLKNLERYGLYFTWKTVTIWNNEVYSYFSYSAFIFYVTLNSDWT